MNKKIERTCFNHRRKETRAYCLLQQYKGPVQVFVNEKLITFDSLKGQEYLYLLNLVNLKNIIFKIFTKGGGNNSVQECSLSILAKGIIKLKGPSIRNELLKLNPWLLTTDSRRVWPKHAGGRKSRAKRQKSYR